MSVDRIKMFCHLKIYEMRSCDAPSLEVLKARLDGALSNLI